jgi:hypothetical protein
MPLGWSRLACQSSSVAPIFQRIRFPLAISGFYLHCRFLSEMSKKIVSSSGPHYKVYQGGILASPSTKAFTEVSPDDIVPRPPSPTFSLTGQSTSKNGFFKKIAGIARYSFLPQGFPESVHPNFKGYAGWFFLQNIVGNMVYGNMWA